MSETPDLEYWQGSGPKRDDDGNEIAPGRLYPYPDAMLVDLPRRNFVVGDAVRRDCRKGGQDVKTRTMYVRCPSCGVSEAFATYRPPRPMAHNDRHRLTFAESARLGDFLAAHIASCAPYGESPLVVIELCRTNMIEGESNPVPEPVPAGTGDCVPGAWPPEQTDTRSPGTGPVRRATSPIGNQTPQKPHQARTLEDLDAMLDAGPHERGSGT